MSIAFDNRGKKFYMVDSKMIKDVSKYYVRGDGSVHLCPECVSDEQDLKVHECFDKKVALANTKTIGDLVRAWNRYWIEYTDCTQNFTKMRIVDVHEPEHPLSSYYVNDEGMTKPCYHCQFEKESLFHDCQNCFVANNLDHIIAARERPVYFPDSVLAEDWSDYLSDIVD